MNLPERYPPWGWVHVLVVLLVILGLGLLYGRYGSFLFFYLVYKYHFPATAVAEFLLSYAVQFLATVVAVLAAVRVAGGTLKDLGFRQGRFLAVLKWGGLGGFILFIFISGLGFVLEHLVPQLPPQPFEVVLRETGNLGDFAFLLLAGAFMAPLAEEMYFRGMAYPVFSSMLGKKWGIVVSALFFGLMHFDLWRLIPLVLGGAALAYIYEKSDTIWAPWLAHGIWNGCMAVALFCT